MNRTIQFATRLLALALLSLVSVDGKEITIDIEAFFVGVECEYEKADHPRSAREHYPLSGNQKFIEAGEFCRNCLEKGWEAKLKPSGKIVKKDYENITINFDTTLRLNDLKDQIATAIKNSDDQDRDARERANADFRRKFPGNRKLPDIPVQRRVLAESINGIDFSYQAKASPYAYRKGTLKDDVTITLLPPGWKTDKLDDKTCYIDPSGKPHDLPPFSKNLRLAVVVGTMFVNVKMLNSRTNSAKVFCVVPGDTIANLKEAIYLEMTILPAKQTITHFHPCNCNSCKTRHDQRNCSKTEKLQLQDARTFEQLVQDPDIQKFTHGVTLLMDGEEGYGKDIPWLRSIKPAKSDSTLFSRVHADNVLTCLQPGWRRIYNKYIGPKGQTTSKFPGRIRRRRLTNQRLIDRFIRESERCLQS